MEKVKRKEQWLPQTRENEILLILCWFLPLCLLV